MGLKKAKKPAAEGKVAEAQVHEPGATKKKKFKVRPASEIDDIFGQKAPVVEPDKTTAKAVKAKAKSEIDDIFGQKKRRMAEGEHDEAAARKKERENSEVVKLNSKGELVKPKKPKVATASAKSTPAAAAPTSRKKTEDGFTVYTAEELGFNKKNAGGTKLCPFDCDCCF